MLQNVVYNILLGSKNENVNLLFVCPAVLYQDFYNQSVAEVVLTKWHFDGAACLFK